MADADQKNIKYDVTFVGIAVAEEGSNKYGDGKLQLFGLTHDGYVYRFDPIDNLWTILPSTAKATAKADLS